MSLTPDSVPRFGWSALGKHIIGSEIRTGGRVTKKIVRGVKRLFHDEGKPSLPKRTNMSRGSSSGKWKGTVTTATSRLATSRTKGKAHAKDSKKHKTKISKHFKEAVETALKTKECHGLFVTTYAGKFIGSPGTTYQDQYQNIYVLPILLNSATPGVYQSATGVDFNFFSPQRILDAASVLFNGRPPGFDYTAGINFFDQTKLKILVENSYVEFFIQNNTQRVQLVKCYECVPVVNTNDNVDAVLATSFNNDNTDGINLPSFLDPTGVHYEATGISGCGVTCMDVTPNLSKKFKNTYKYKVHEILMEPGQSHQFSIQGPKDHTYDFEKFKDASGTFKYPKGLGVNCMFTTQAMFGSSNTGITSVFAPNGIAPSGYGILVDQV